MISIIRRAKYNQRDLILYALSINCTNEKYIFEGSSNFQPFPTFIATLAFRGESNDIQHFPPPSMLDPLPSVFIVEGQDKSQFSKRRIVIHVSQDFVFLGGLPVPKGPGENIDIDVEQRILKVTPKRRGVFITVITNYSVFHDDMKSDRQIFCEGFSTYVVIGIPMDCVKAYEDPTYVAFAQRHSNLTPPSTQTEIFKREPDRIIEIRLKSDQSLLYRVASGDYNWIHVKGIDGDKPIMHGLCTLGIVVQKIYEYISELSTKNQMHDISHSIRKISVRFSAPIPIGSTINLSVWKANNKLTMLCFEASLKGKPVLRNGLLDVNLSSEANFLNIKSMI